MATRKERRNAPGAQPNPGVRTDRAASDIRSRSDDPGQSSYGGFKNEDPRRQHQGDASRKPGQRQGK